MVFNDWTSDMIKIVNGSKFTMRDVHLTRSTPGATQGFVNEVRDDEIILEIPPGKSTVKIKSQLKYSFYYKGNPSVKDLVLHLGNPFII